MLTKRISALGHALDIVIVNWNAGVQLRHCLKSIPQADPTREIVGQVVVVDNNSHDGSIDGLDELGLPLTVIRNTTNLGFGAACNQGAFGSRADYLLFLNPDTILFQDSLILPYQFMENSANAGIGICGIQLVDETGKICRSSARFPTLRQTFSRVFGLSHLYPRQFPEHSMEEWDHGNSQKVDQVIGAFFWVRRTVFEAMKGFDPRFFVYFEEVDLSFRAAQAGWASFYLTEGRAFHKGHGTTDQVKPARLFYSLQSRIYYGFKHFSIFSAFGLALLTLLVEPFSRLFLCAAKGSCGAMFDVIRGYAMLYGSIARLLVRKVVR